jgi:trehalose 6-phosphate phosphatase
MPRTIADLPNALTDRDLLTHRPASQRPAVFLHYDGVLTPIVARPEDAVIWPGMRATVQALSRRCPVCVISGRDRTVVQRLMGIDDLVVAGSHGFDIWSPRLGTLDHPEAAGSGKLISEASEHVRDRLDGVHGVLIEPKKVSVAVHYRLVAPAKHEKVAAAVRAVVAEFAPSLKVTPGKDVYEIQPNLDWNKGRALQFLLTALRLDGPGVLPFYLGDEITDEDAFQTLRGRGVGIIVGRPDDPEVEGRPTAAELALASVDEVQQFLDAIAR